MFEFGLLSWFHFYVAICTAATVVFFGHTKCSSRTLGFLVAGCAALLVPLAPQVLGGTGFLSGSFSILDQILEVQSPYTLFTTMFGPVATASFYSWLLIAAPVLAAFFAYRAFRETTGQRLYFAVAAAFGLLLLLSQFRLHYFGSFALITGPLLLVDALRARFQWHRGVVFTGAAAALTLAFQPALRERLFLPYAPGSAPDYASVLPLYLELARFCDVEPGVVLAHSDDGSAVLFHTECSVIANNFILRPADAAHIEEVVRLFRLTPDEIRRQRRDVRYVLMRARDFYVPVSDGLLLDPDSATAQQLLTDRAPPEGFELLKTVLLEVDSSGNTAIFARLYRVEPLGGDSAEQAPSVSQLTGSTETPR
jgi:hypothetical protein